MFVLFSEPPLLALGLPLSPMSFYCLLLKFLGGDTKSVFLPDHTSGVINVFSKWRLSPHAIG